MSDIQPGVPANRQPRPEGETNTDEIVTGDVVRDDSTRDEVVRGEVIEEAVIVEDSAIEPGANGPVVAPVAYSAPEAQVGDTLVVDEVVVVDESGTPVRTEAVPPTVVEVEAVHATATEPVVATTDASAAVIPTPEPERQPVPVAAAAPQVVYVQAPAEPKKKGNRGIGALIALASALVYAIVFALVVFLITLVQSGQATFAFVTDASFYVPVLFYVIGLVLLVLILNRAGWAAYVVGSILVGVVVYFGTIAVIALGQGVVMMTPAEAGFVFSAGLFNPFVIAAALVAREVSLWMGHLISRRGRRIKTRNAEARDAWQRELAETRAERDRAATASASAR